ncbi:hypothetical protein EDD21DRAFT_330268 [Dissophora ornata]|nr:hypothetical protein EDD21DRAFT_330268 [Dissophora ornata]
MVDAFELRPFTLCNQHGRLYHAVAHSRVVEQLTIGPVTVTSTDITPFKRQRVECESCRPAACPGLENLFNVSPYVATLQTRQFIELDDEMCSFLNQDWTFQSSLQYACAQILAGSIFYNPRNGHTVINNTVETYGRTRSVDAHRERITVVKDVLSPSTLPPNTRTCYKNVYPLTYYYSQEGERLALGTQTFNILVTSSLRLDVVEPPSVGGTVGSFQMRSVQDCSVARIFLDMESVQAGLSVAKEGRTSIWPSNLFTQLRQLKTLFHDGSTYRLCRAAGFLTQGHNCQPFTVFTLVDFDGSKSLSAQSGSKLLRTIAASVLESGTSAVLTLDTVKSLRDQCKDSREIRTQFDAIVRLFTGVDTTLLIIGNSSLNAELATLAKKLSSYIDTANKSSVQSSIKMAFPVNSPPQK